MSLNAEAKIVNHRLSVLRRRRGREPGECVRGLPAARHVANAVLRVQATFPDPRDRGLARPATDPPFTSGDDSPGDRGADPGHQPGASQLGYVALEGIGISGPTVQRILNDHEMGTRYHRWLKLEEQRAAQAIELTPDQVKFIEKQNPVFRERHVESSRPGELLCQDTFFVGTLKGVGKVYMHAVVDTFSSYAFAFLHTTKRPEAAVAVLHNDVLPFYQERDACGGSVLS